MRQLSERGKLLLIISVANIKGGVGKTSVSVFLAQALANMNKAVLVVDIDHNNNLTDYFLRNVERETLRENNIMHAIKGDKKLEEVIYSWENLFVCPATPALAIIGKQLKEQYEKTINDFSASLRSLKYDVIIIDTPPALVLELDLALNSSDMVLVPLSSNRWSVIGYEPLAYELAAINQKRHIKKQIKVLGLPAIVTEKEAEFLQQHEKEIQLPFAKQAIHRNISIKNATTQATKINPSVKVWGDFVALAEEILTYAT